MPLVKRKNFTFHLEDERERVVYDYFSSLGKSMTTELVDVFYDIAINHDTENSPEKHVVVRHKRMQPKLQTSVQEPKADVVTQDNQKGHDYSRALEQDKKTHEEVKQEAVGEPEVEDVKEVAVAPKTKEDEDFDLLLSGLSILGG